MIVTVQEVWLLRLLFFIQKISVVTIHPRPLVMHLHSIQIKKSKRLYQALIWRKTNFDSSDVGSKETSLDEEDIKIKQPCLAESDKDPSFTTSGTQYK